VTTADGSSEVRAIKDADQALVARAAAILHTNGESTSVTLIAAERLNRGLKRNFEVIPTWTSVSVLDAGRDALLVPAPPTAVAMRAVTIAMSVIDRVGEGSAERSELKSALDRASRTKPANLAIFLVACAAAPAALAIIFGVADLPAVLLAALSGALGGLVRRLLAHIGVGQLGQVFVAASIAGVIGGIAVNADLSSSLRLIAVCPAMILVPGPHILNGVLDLFALRISLGFSRLGYAAILIVAIGIGLAVSLALFGTTLPAEPAGRTVPLWLDVVAAAVAAACYPVFFAMPYRLIVVPVVIGAIAHGLRTFAINDLGVNIAVGATIACSLVGIVLAPVSHRLHIPYAAVGFAAVMALVPGVYLFRMIDNLATLAFGGNTADLLGAISDGITAALVILGMAIGLALPNHIHSELIRSRRAAQ